MDGGSIALVAFASFLAIRTLLVLMKAHEQKIRSELAMEAAQRRRVARQEGQPT
jgi:hypothetical protein